METRRLEAFVGAAVLFLAAGFLLYVHNKTSISNKEGTYALSALFQSVESLERDAAVNMSGVRIGTVESIRLRPDNFMAQVRFSVSRNIQIPQDSTATIASKSLLGHKMLVIKPGMSATNLKAGDVIERTESPITIEKAISRFMFSTDDKKNDKKADAPTPAGPDEEPQSIAQAYGS